MQRTILTISLTSFSSSKRGISITVLLLWGTLLSIEAGLKEIPSEGREVELDEAILEMGVENIQREDLSYYERGRWVSKMKGLGWTITGLAE